mgnify:CR=1 FL=1
MYDLFPYFFTEYKIHINKFIEKDTVYNRIFKFLKFCNYDTIHFITTYILQENLDNTCDYVTIIYASNSNDYEKKDDIDIIIFTDTECKINELGNFKYDKKMTKRQIFEFDSPCAMEYLEYYETYFKNICCIGDSNSIEYLKNWIKDEKYEYG